MQVVGIAARALDGVVRASRVEHDQFIGPAGNRAQTAINLAGLVFADDYHAEFVAALKGRIAEVQAAASMDQSGGQRGKQAEPDDAAVAFEQGFRQGHYGDCRQAGQARPAQVSGSLETGLPDPAVAPKGNTEHQQQDHQAR